MVTTWHRVGYVISRCCMSRRQHLVNRLSDRWKTCFCGLVCLRSAVTSQIISARDCDTVRVLIYLFIFDSLLFHLVWENDLWRVCVRRKDSHLVLLVCWIKKFQSYSVISNTHMEKTLFFTNLLLVILLKIKISRSENSSLFALISV